MCRMRFGPGFDWVRGGKLPGLCAGQCPTGCDKSISPNEGFSARIMWTEYAPQGLSQHWPWPWLPHRIDVAVLHSFVPACEGS